MKIYWSIADIPELKKLPPSKRSEVWKACYLKSFKHWQSWVGMLVLGLSSWLALKLFFYLLHLVSQWGLLLFLPGLIAILAFIASVAFLISQNWFEQTRPHLRDYIENHTP